MNYISLINEYQMFYDTYHDKIQLACDCVDANPCSILNDEVINIKNVILKPLYSLDWDDSVKDVFVSNLDICVKDLDLLSESIQTRFKSSEELYRVINNELKNLNNEILAFEGIIDQEPKKSTYKEEVNDEFGNFLRYIFPGYQTAYDTWTGNCNSCNSRCLALKQSITEKLSQLEVINGEQTAINSQVSIPLQVNTGNASEFAYFTEDVDSILNSNAVEYTRSSDGTLTVRYNQSMGPWMTTIDGVSIKRAGCGILSLATALTATFSYQSGTDVIVSPLDVANALNDYANANGAGGLSTYFPNGMGSYEGLTDAVSDIYGVTILYNDSNQLTQEQIVNATDTSGAVVYSLRSESHIAAVTGLNDNEKLMIADTGSGRASYVYGTDSFDGGKRSMLVALGDFGVSGNYLTKNGSTQFADIGNMEHIVINGENYEITRQQVGDTDLYEYIINFNSND